MYTIIIIIFFFKSLFFCQAVWILIILPSKLCHLKVIDYLCCFALFTDFDNDNSDFATCRAFFTMLQNRLHSSLCNQPSSGGVHN